MGKLAAGQAPPPKKRRKRRASKSRPKNPPAICALCHELAKAPVKHHLQYDPPVVVDLHPSCHRRLHAQGAVWNDPITARAREAVGPTEARAVAPLEFALAVVEMYEEHLLLPVLLPEIERQLAVQEAAAVAREVRRLAGGNGNGRAGGGRTGGNGNGRGGGTGSSTVH